MKLVAWLKRKLEFLSDKILSCSNTVRNHWDRNNTGKHHVVFLPVDIEKVGNPQIAIDHKSFKSGTYPVIGMVSRICPGKGHEYLIRALPDILDEFPAVKVKIVGKGPLLDDLKRLAQEINVANSIVFTGYVQDIYTELNSLDVFILPSLSEGFPISILEAMAAGLPVVASNVGGISEAVEDGVTGFLFKAKNTKELASAVKRMLSDRAQAVKMGNAARKKILNEFSPEKYIEKMELLYRTLAVEKAI
jgi:glycosyltransferase involved in cell wall biosynthesis